MDSFLAWLSRGVEQLLGRASGPFHLRLFLTPAVATFYAIRTGIRDARQGRPPFLWHSITNPAERPAIRRSWLKDIGTMIIVVFAVDVAYQIIVLKAFYVVQALILVVVLAMAPYALIRGITTRLASRGLEEKS